MVKIYEGSPCRAGHTERYAANGNCRTCAIVALRKHRERNAPLVRAKNRARYARNAAAACQKSRDYQQRNKDRVLQAKRRYRGLPEPIRPCPARCEVCSGLPGRKALALDHDHATGRFRGWLCGGCNTALGHVKDSPKMLRALADYLEKS